MRNPEQITGDLGPTIATWLVDLLEDPDVGLDDNFLDVGGHSMLAIELNERVHALVGVKIDLTLLFEGTLREAVADLESRHRDTTNSQAI